MTITPEPPPAALALLALPERVDALAAEVARLRLLLEAALDSAPLPQRPQHHGEGPHEPDPEGLDPARQLVNLDQAAAMVSRSKAALRKHLDELPPAALAGKPGVAALWRWSTLRPWLERQYRRALPPVFPGKVIIDPFPEEEEAAPPATELLYAG